jgi:GNAT superfamily N-acetyltransferase
LVADDGIRIRQALPDDQPAIARLIEAMEPGDYLAEVIDSWLTAPDGVIGLAEAGRDLVGLNRLVDLGQGEWWLEGLRVRPDKRGRGIARRLHDSQVARWQAGPGRALRFGSYHSRAAVHHIGEMTGFRLAAGVELFEGSAERGGHKFQQNRHLPAGVQASAPPGEIGPLRMPVLEVSWQWVAAGLPRLEEYADRGEFWLWNGGPGAIVLGPDHSYQSDQAVLRWLTVEQDDLSLMLSDARRLADSLGCAGLRWQSPFGEPGGRAAGQAGFQSGREELMLIFERLR